MFASLSDRDEKADGRRQRLGVEGLLELVDVLVLLLLGRRHEDRAEVQLRRKIVALVRLSLRCR